MKIHNDTSSDPEKVSNGELAVIFLRCLSRDGSFGVESPIFRQHNGLVGAFRLKRPDRCPVRILWVYHAREGFSEERIRIRTPPTVIDSILTLISIGKTEVICGDE